VLAIQICVAEDGRVSEAALRSAVSPTLDGIVLEAVRSWRYHPRLVDGQPAPFCHGVVIRYERAL
jgi:outer membrane biosynthesis protein TonB